jgi:hypothetical protein
VIQKKVNLLWEITEKSQRKDIVMTVGLPCIKAGRSIWLALESLKRQKKVDFGWELIIWEDLSDSTRIIESFLGYFPGCQRVIHRIIDPKTDGHEKGSMMGKFPLIDKWIGIAGDSSKTSKIFVLQACDCYSSPYRLYIHNTHFKNKKCYFSTQLKGLFYNLINKKKVFYAPNISRLAKTAKKSLHLNMAFMTKDIKNIKPIAKKSGIDAYLFRSISKMKSIKAPEKHIFFDSSVIKSNWKYSLDTDGANNISIKRLYYYDNPRGHVYFFDYKQTKKKMGYERMDKYIPKNVIQFLEKPRF